MSGITEFYTGNPVDPQDLRFRDPFIDELWKTLATKHVLLTAPRRTGKTSVMDHLRDVPRDGFAVVSVNVQDLSHPADFFQSLLDAFHDAHPDYFRDKLASGWNVVKSALSKFKEVGFGGFKIALREADPDWKNHWRQFGDTFLAQVRKVGDKVLFIVDELPDMLLQMQKENPNQLREFLAWWRTQRNDPTPRNDNLRWLVGGSVNLKSTLDGMGKVDLINDLEDVALPPLTSHDVRQFVEEMLRCRAVVFDADVPAQVEAKLGRPIPIFLQMITRELCRMWERAQTNDNHRGIRITCSHVDQAFHELVRTGAAQDKLQHYYSRIRTYYAASRAGVAYELLSMLSMTPAGLARDRLFQVFERLLQEAGQSLPLHERKQHFNQLLRDLENDFYVVEVTDQQYDFASGILKAWWAKFYA